MRSDRRIFAVGFVLSMALHAAALWAFRSVPAGGGEAPVTSPAMTVVALAPPPGHPLPEMVIPPPPLRAPEPVVPASSVPIPEPAAVGPSLSAALGAWALVRELAPTEAPSPRPRDAGPAAHRVALMQYEQAVAQWLERYREYPLAAKRRRWEGTAIVRLQLTADGSLLAAQLVRHTGHSVLDQAALGMVERAAPFPRLPDHLNGGQIEILVPIQFSLGS